jgi:hypothetical protein
VRLQRDIPMNACFQPHEYQYVMELIASTDQ